MILITGSNGQLGTELCKLLDAKQIAYIATDAIEMDITNKEVVDTTFQRVKPTIVFHCAAYTAVDKAEDEGKDLDEKINVLGTKNIAEAAEAVEARLVHISTDYVFDGTYEGEYTIDAETNPKNEYGRTKLEAEKLVQSIMTNYYIIRTSWVFGEYGNNFVYTMRRLAKTHSTLSVVSDQVGRPTWTRTLAEFMLHVMETKPETGLYHLSNDNSCSWYEFATEILKDFDVEVNPVSSEEFPQKAYRPKHSVMNLSRAKATGFVIITWQEALNRFIHSL